MRYPFLLKVLAISMAAFVVARLGHGADGKVHAAADTTTTQSTPAKATHAAPAKSTRAAPAKSTHAAPAKSTHAAPAKSTRAAAPASARKSHATAARVARPPAKTAQARTATAASSTPASAAAPSAETKSVQAAAAKAANSTARSRQPSLTPSAAQAGATVALAGLIGGNERFVTGRPEHPHQDGGVLHALAAGQKPQVVVLSCADSRVPPEIVFDQGLGDLFVVRVAGNTLDAATVASIEYAVEHLGALLVVVLGHQSCGAVQAALETPPKAAASPDLERLLAAIRPGIQQFLKGPGDPLLDGAVRANVDASAAGLLRRSAIIRERAGSGLLTLVPAVYLIDSGRVEFWDAAATQAGLPEKR